MTSRERRYELIPDVISIIQIPSQDTSWMRERDCELKYKLPSETTEVVPLKSNERVSNGGRRSISRSSTCNPITACTTDSISSRRGGSRCGCNSLGCTIYYMSRVCAHRNTHRGRTRVWLCAEGLSVDSACVFHFLLHGSITASSDGLVLRTDYNHWCLSLCEYVMGQRVTAFYCNPNHFNSPVPDCAELTCPVCMHSLMPQTDWIYNLILV